MALRSEQIQNYLIVMRQQKTGQVLLEIKQKLDLKGKFDAIKNPLVGKMQLQYIFSKKSEHLNSKRDFLSSTLAISRD